MPEDILPDVWVNECERQQQKTKVVHLSKLPTDTALLLDPSIYSGRHGHQSLILLHLSDPAGGAPPSLSSCLYFVLFLPSTPPPPCHQ
ncbi:hypothetical protein CRUP_011269 [Coryphaenoides rupestris]|nr:hypothetical protein CRUP_011269 [Coryphaenoides rupestris]